MSNDNKNIIQENSFSFFDLIKLTLIYKRLIAAIFSISIFISLIYFVLSPSVFKATTLVVPTSGSLTKANTLDSILSSINLVSSSAQDIDLETNMAILKSRNFVKNFVTSNNIQPAIVPAYNLRRNIAELVYNQIDLDEVVYLSFLDSLTISSVGNLIEISLSLRDQENVAELTNKLIESLNLYIRSRAIAETSRNIDFIERNLENTSLVQIQPTFYEIIEKEIQKSMLANGNEQYAFTVIDYAFTPKDRIHPKFLMIMVPTLIFSSIISLVIIYFYSFFLRKKFRP